MDAGSRVALARPFIFLNIWLGPGEEGLVTGPSLVSGCVSVKFDALEEGATSFAVEVARLVKANPEGGGPSQGQ